MTKPKRSKKFIAKTITDLLIKKAIKEGPKALVDYMESFNNNNLKVTMNTNIEELMGDGGTKQALVISIDASEAAFKGMANKLHSDIGKTSKSKKSYAPASVFKPGFYVRSHLRNGKTVRAHTRQYRYNLN